MALVYDVIYQPMCLCHGVLCLWHDFLSAWLTPCTHEIRSDWLLTACLQAFSSCPWGLGLKHGWARATGTGGLEKERVGP